MPKRANTASIVGSSNSLFLSPSGSMEGAIKTCGIGSFCEKAGAENTAASYRGMNCRRNSQIFGSGREKSIWHRHSQFLPIALVEKRDRLGIMNKHNVAEA